jgi:precorrin-2 dehydrogenase/sirohydrochlorin ferrochelatase
MRMSYLPIFLDVSGRNCVVIGGGDIAERKVRSLIEAGASVTVISPEITGRLADMVHAQTIRHLQRAYWRGDLIGAFLAFEATGDRRAAEAATEEARERGVPINAADVPELCDFIAPAVVHRGDLQIAVSTGGASPALARKIREELEARFGPEYESAVDFLAAARKWVQSHQADGGARALQLGALVNSDLLECFRRGNLGAVEAIALRVLGATFAELGFETTRPPVAVDGRTNATRGSTDATDGRTSESR